MLANNYDGKEVEVLTTSGLTIRGIVTGKEKYSQNLIMAPKSAVDGGEVYGFIEILHSQIVAVAIK